MKRSITILIILALTSAWAQKPVSEDNAGRETTGIERLHHQQQQSGGIDPELIQEIRAVKAVKDRSFIKRQMLSATPEGPKSFEVSQSESRFAVIKEIIDRIKTEESAKKMTRKRAAKQNKRTNKEPVNNMLDLGKKDGKD